MDFDKIIDPAYIEWFTHYYGKNPANYGKEDLPEILKKDPNPLLFLQKFAQDISRLTVEEYHKELAKKLKEYDIHL